MKVAAIYKKGGSVFSRERGIENLLSNIIAHFIAIVVGAFDSRCERTQQWEEDDGSKVGHHRIFGVLPKTLLTYCHLE